MRTRRIQIQCSRCRGWFEEDEVVECVTAEGEYLSDLCNQCMNGWIEFEAFTEANE